MRMSEYEAFLRDRADDDTRRAASNQSAVVCLAAPGVPVIYVSDSFEEYTGYPPAEVIGRSLSLLQGPDTEESAVATFRTLIENGQSGTICITNYRKDKTRFVHECALRPIRDGDGAVTHFIAIQKLVESEIDHN